MDKYILSDLEQLSYSWILYPQKLLEKKVVVLLG